MKIESKGGTLDVGFHVGTRKPDTVLATNFALINALNENNCLIKMLYLSYKTYLLYDTLTTYSKKTKRMDAANLKSVQLSLNKCLDELKSDLEKMKMSNAYYHPLKCKKILD